MSLVLGIATVSAFIPLEQASTVHTTIATDVNDQDQILVFEFHDLTAASEKFITSKITDGWVGKVNLAVCDSDDANPGKVAVDVDINGNGDTADANESDVVSVDLSSATCGSSEATLPAGVDQIAIVPSTDVETIIVTLVLDTNPEI